MINYYRNNFYEASLRSWIVPSPNIPTVDTAVVYAGMSRSLFLPESLSFGSILTRVVLQLPWCNAQQQKHQPQHRE